MGAKQCVENVCMYAALFRLYSRIITQIAHHRVRHRACHRGSIPMEHCYCYLKPI